MSTVQFRWIDGAGNTRLVGQFNTEWIFQEGLHFEFWGGMNEVASVKTIMHAADGDLLEVIQIVIIKPHWYNPQLHLTPEEVWKNSTVL